MQSLVPKTVATALALDWVGRLPPDDPESAARSRVRVNALLYAAKRCRRGWHDWADRTLSGRQRRHLVLFTHIQRPF